MSSEILHSYLYPRVDAVIVTVPISTLWDPLSDKPLGSHIIEQDIRAGAGFRLPQEALVPSDVDANTPTADSA